MNPATAYHQLKNILAKTKLECAAKLAQLWDALKEPTLDQPKPEILLADWLDLCYQEYKKPNLLPNTQMSYERRIYQHIILKLGQIQPDKLNTTDIQEFYVSLKKDGSELSSTAKGCQIRPFAASTRLSTLLWTKLWRKT